MSKNNMLLGYARGKVGSLVFNRLKGQQITKAHNASPANPKSYAQMAQRCRYNTAVARYKMATRKFFKFAYEDKRPHESDFNAFMRHNMMAEPYCTKNMIVADTILSAPLIVSTGSLTRMPWDGLGVIYDSIDIPHVPKGEYLIIDIADALPIFGNVRDFDISVSEMSQLFIDFFPWLKDGDLITFVCYAFDNSFIPSVEDGIPAKSQFYFNQFKLDLSDIHTNLANIKNYPFHCPGGEQCYINFGINQAEYFGDPVAYSGIIVTRKNENGGILASNCTLSPSQVAIVFWQDYPMSGFNNRAIASYSPTTPAILNPDK